MSDSSTDPTEPTEPVAEDAPAAADAPEGSATPDALATASSGATQTVTRKAAALGLAGAFVVGGLVGWVGATAFDDDDTVPISAFQDGRFPGGMPGGPGGMEGGGRHGGPHDQMGGGGFPGGPGGGFPGGEMSDEQREELEQRLEDGELPPWVEEHLDDDGDRGDDGYDQDQDQDEDQDQDQGQGQDDDA